MSTFPLSVSEPQPESQIMYGLHAPRTRWGAFGIHLTISALIFVALVGLIVGWLFPGALFQAAGGWQGVRIIAGVDLVLGPMLTLIVYNIAKPRLELVRDLSIIATIQVAALLAGMYIVYQQRPVAVTWVYDRFHVSEIADYQYAGVATADLRHMHPLRPAIEYIELPQSEAEIAEILIRHEMSGEKLQFRTDLARPLPDTAGDAEFVMRFNSRGGADSTRSCVPVIVESDFGEFSLCYDVARQRFAG